MVNNKNYSEYLQGIEILIYHIFHLLIYNNRFLCLIQQNERVNQNYFAAHCKMKLQ